MSAYRTETISIVNVRWLLACIETWQLAPEGGHPACSQTDGTTSCTHRKLLQQTTVWSCCADDFQGYAPLDLRGGVGDASQAQAAGAPIASSGAVLTVTASAIGSRLLLAASGSGPQQAAAGTSVQKCLETMTAEVDMLDEENEARTGGGGGMLMGSYGFHNLDADAVRTILRRSIAGPVASV